jgi:hypothetical protein
MLKIERLHELAPACLADHTDAEVLAMQEDWLAEIDFYGPGTEQRMKQAFACYGLAMVIQQRAEAERRNEEQDDD